MDWPWCTRSWWSHSFFFYEYNEQGPYLISVHAPVCNTSPTGSGPEDRGPNGHLAPLYTALDVEIHCWGSGPYREAGGQSSRAANLGSPQMPCCLLAMGSSMATPHNRPHWYQDWVGKYVRRRWFHFVYEVDCPETAPPEFAEDSVLDAFINVHVELLTEQSCVWRGTILATPLRWVMRFVLKRERKELERAR